MADAPVAIIKENQIQIEHAVIVTLMHVIVATDSRPGEE